MKEILKISFLLLLIIALAVGCKDDDENTCCDPTNPECPNYDPCFGKVNTTALFTISQRLSSFGDNASVFIEDDVVTGGTLKFTAIPQEGAIYTWILGSDTTVGGPEITTNLGNLPFGTYPNSLIVTKPADTLCFPDDSGIDEFTRSFTAVSICEAAILGRYQGVFASQPNDSTEIEFAVSSSPLEILLPCDPNNITSVFFVNANMEGDTLKTGANGFANTVFPFVAFGAIDQPEGTAVIDLESNIMTVTYTLGDSSYSFTGIKL
jgi:hypothetical protein